MKNRFTKFFFTLILCTFSMWTCKAQYITSAGARAGKVMSGVDIKHFIDGIGYTGIEVCLGYTQEGYGGYSGRVFFVKQLPVQKPWVPFPFRLIFRQSRLQIPLKMVFGVGSHVSYLRDHEYLHDSGEGLSSEITEGYNTFSAGIDAMVGLEYNTRRMPVTIGIDAIPYYSFMGATGKDWIDFGVNVRYIFTTNKR